MGVRTVLGAMPTGESVTPHPSHALRASDRHCIRCSVLRTEAAIAIKCLYANKMAGMAKRGYSRDFTPQTDRRVRFEVDRIPPTLYEAVKAKAKREGLSLRALTLQLWKDWVEQ